MKIHELLAKPEAWTQGFWARDVDNRSIYSHAPDAVCWCLTGAFNRCYAYLDGDARKQIRDKILAATGLSDFLDVMAWNDDPKRTHAEVLELARKLDI